MAVRLYGFVNRFLYAAKCLLSRTAYADKKVTLARRKSLFLSFQKAVAGTIIQLFHVRVNLGSPFLFGKSRVPELFGVDWHNAFSFLCWINII